MNLHVTGMSLYSDTIQAIRLRPCPKDANGKAVPARETLNFVKKRLAASPLRVLAQIQRIDTGRLDIPVYLAVPAKDACAVLPGKRQMGKGTSPELAEASALMELVERFSFFSFWRDMPGAVHCTFSQARARFGTACLAVEDILACTHEDMPHDSAVRILDCLDWCFFPATCIADGEIRWLPLDWFRMLGEFNGASAGNTAEESILQGACELVERHVSCRFDRERPTLPTIDAESLNGSHAYDVLRAFFANGVTVLLKDMSMGMPVPTVAALAWDEATFPHASEIVFTAGTASSPEQAALRALTEVAQLAGDFQTAARYEASGLPKFHSREECAPLLQGPLVALHSLPDLKSPDICDELLTLARALGQGGYPLYSVATSHPFLDIPAHYSVVAGFDFRERDKNASLGLFAAKALCERSGIDPAAVEHGLQTIDAVYPGNHFIPFYRAMQALQNGDPAQRAKAAHAFAQAETLQPDADSRALAAFYSGYAHTQGGDWQAALPALARAAELAPDVLEYRNLLGVALFKTEDFAAAALHFAAAVNIDKSSAPDLANLGICHKRMNDAPRALELLRAALHVDPGLDYARRELAELEEVEGADFSTR